MEQRITMSDRKIIYLDDALDAVNLMTDINGFCDGYAVSRKGVCITLKQLPPAQPKQTYCDYCHEDSDGFVIPIEKNNHAVIHGSVLHLKAKGWRGKVQIKYCPMCGRRLER